jgi:hypothetical protein
VRGMAPSTAGTNRGVHVSTGHPNVKMRAPIGKENNEISLLYRQGFHKVGCQTDTWPPVGKAKHLGGAALLGLSPSYHERKVDHGYRQVPHLRGAGKAVHHH